MMQPQALASVLQEYEKAYEVITEKTKTLENFRDEYKALRVRLKTLPDKIEYEALVPLGTKALVPGKIIHTNEVLCMLGDSWFMECSAKTAVEIVDRRIRTCNKHLEAQRKEAERLEHWRKELSKLILESTEQDSEEILELVTEEECEKMEKEHRESVRKYHQELARERVGKTPEERKKEEEDFWARLEELELEEEMQQAEEEYEKRKKQQQFEAKPKNANPKVGNLKSPQPSPFKSKNADTSPRKPKVTKSVSFNNTPEIREIPPISPTNGIPNFHDYTDTLEPEDFPVIPTQNVVGIKEKIVERAPPVPVVSLNPTKSEEEVPGPSSAASIKTAIFDPREAAVPPKKSSLFKQRRNQ